MWRKIEELPEVYMATNRMFVVVGIDVEIGAGRLYTTDPYCVWRGRANGVFVRWPHDYKPTHFMELPEKHECN